MISTRFSLVISFYSSLNLMAVLHKVSFNWCFLGAFYDLLNYCVCVFFFPSLTITEDHWTSRCCSHSWSKTNYGNIVLSSPMYLGFCKYAWMNEPNLHFALTGWLEWCWMPHQLQVFGRYNIHGMKVCIIQKYATECLIIIAFTVQRAWGKKEALKLLRRQFWICHFATQSILVPMEKEMREGWQESMKQPALINFLGYALKLVAFCIDLLIKEPKCFPLLAC